MERQLWAEPVPPPRPSSNAMRPAPPYAKQARARTKEDMEALRMQYIEGNSLHNVLADTMARCLKDMPEDPCSYLAMNLMEAGQRRIAAAPPTAPPTKLDELRAEAAVLREQLQQLHCAPPMPMPMPEGTEEEMAEEMEEGMAEEMGMEMELTPDAEVRAVTAQHVENEEFEATSHMLPMATMRPVMVDAATATLPEPPVERGPPLEPSPPPPRKECAAKSVQVALLDDPPPPPPADTPTPTVLSPISPVLSAHPEDATKTVECQTEMEGMMDVQFPNNEDMGLSFTCRYPPALPRTEGQGSTHSLYSESDSALPQALEPRAVEPAAPNLNAEPLKHPLLTMPAGVPQLSTVSAARGAGHGLIAVADFHALLHETWKVVQAWGVANFTKLFYSLYESRDANGAAKLKKADCEAFTGKAARSGMVHSLDEFFSSKSFSKSVETWKVLAARICDGGGHAAEDDAAALKHRLTADDFTVAAMSFADAIVDVAGTFGQYMDHSLAGCWLRLFGIMAHSVLEEVDAEENGANANNTLHVEDLARYGQRKQRLADVLFVAPDTVVDYGDSLDVVDMDALHSTLSKAIMYRAPHFSVPHHPSHLASVCTVTMCGLRDGTLLTDRIRLEPWIRRLRLCEDDFLALNITLTTGCEQLDVDHQLFKSVWAAVAALFYNPYGNTAKRLGVHATELSALAYAWKGITQGDELMASSTGLDELRAESFSDGVDMNALTDMLEAVFPELSTWEGFQSAMQVLVESRQGFGINAGNAKEVGVEYQSRLALLFPFTDSVSNAWAAVWEVMVAACVASAAGNASFKEKPNLAKNTWDTFSGPEKLHVSGVLVQRLGFKALDDKHLCLFLGQVMKCDEVALQGFMPGTALHADAGQHRLLTVAKHPNNDEVAGALEEAFAPFLPDERGRKASVEAWVQLLSKFPYSTEAHDRMVMRKLPLYITRSLDAALNEQVATGAVAGLGATKLDQAEECIKQLLTQTSVEELELTLKRAFKALKRDEMNIFAAIGKAAAAVLPPEDALGYELFIGVCLNRSKPAGTDPIFMTPADAPVDKSATNEIISGSWKRLKAKDCFVNAVWMKLVLLDSSFKRNLFLVWKGRAVTDVLSDLIANLGRYRNLSEKGRGQIMRSAITMYLDFNFQPHHLRELVAAVLFVVKQFDPVQADDVYAAWVQLVEGVIVKHLEPVLPPTYKQREAIITAFREKSFAMHDFVTDLYHYHKTDDDDGAEEKELNAVCQILQALVYTGYNRLLLDELSSKYVCRGGQEYFMKFKRDFVHSLKKYTDYGGDETLRQAWDNMFGFLALTVISTGPEDRPKAQLLMGSSEATYAAKAATYWTKAESFQVGIIYRFLQKFYELIPPAQEVWAHIPMFQQVKRLVWLVNCLFQNHSWASTLLQCAGERWQREGMTEEILRRIPDVLIDTFFEYTPTMSSALEVGWRSLLDKAVEIMCLSPMTEEVTAPTAEDMKLVVESFKPTAQSKDTFLSTMHALDPCCPESVLHNVLQVVIESIDECRDHTTTALAALEDAGDNSPNSLEIHGIWAIVQGLISTLCRDGVSYPREIAWRRFFRYRIAPQIVHERSQFGKYKRRNRLASITDGQNLVDKGPAVEQHMRFCVNYLKSPQDVENLFWALFKSCDKAEQRTPSYQEALVAMEGKGNALGLIDATLCFGDDWAGREEWLYPFFFPFHTVFSPEDAEEVVQTLFTTYQNLCDAIFSDTANWKSVRDRVNRCVAWSAQNVSKELHEHALRQHTEDKRFEEYLISGKVSTTFYQEKLNFVNTPFPPEYLKPVADMWDKAERKVVTLGVEREIGRMSISARTVFTNNIIERIVLFFLQEMLMFVGKFYTLERIRPSVEQLALDLATKGILPAHFKYLHCALVNVVMKEFGVTDAESLEFKAWAAVLGSVVKCMKSSPTPTPYTFKEAKENIIRMIRKDLAGVNPDWRTLVGDIPEFIEAHKDQISKGCEQLLTHMGTLILSFVGLQQEPPAEHLAALHKTLLRIKDEELIALADSVYKHQVPHFDPFVKVFFPLVSVGNLYGEGDAGSSSIWASMSLSKSNERLSTANLSV